MFAGREIFEAANGLHHAWVWGAAELYGSLHPNAGKCRLEIDGTVALFAGDSSPVTQCYGLGVGDGDPSSKLEMVFRFFEGRTAKWELILTPYEAPAIWDLVTSRGLLFDHFENMLYRPLNTVEPGATLPLEARIERLPSDHRAEWEELAIRSFFGDETPPFVDDLMPLMGSVDGSRAYWGLWNGQPVSNATMLVHGRTAFFGGMGTLPAFRGRGFQQAMLHARLRDARDAGADLALIETLPGSGSQRNAERAGFRVAYTSAILVHAA